MSLTLHKTQMIIYSLTCVWHWGSCVLIYIVIGRIKRHIFSFCSFCCDVELNTIIVSIEEMF